MFIFKDTQKRANIYAPYTAPDGTQYSRVPLSLLDEIPDPQPPADYSEDTYYRTEQDEAPYVVYTPKSPEQIAAVMVAKYEAALDAHLDSVAQADRWDNRFTFVARAGYPNMWQQKAIAFGIWMDTCNVQAYQMLQQALTGQIPVPTVEDFIASLPEFTYEPVQE